MSKINKIVELKVELDNLEFEDVGIEIMSLVEEPAIGVHWAAFAAQHLFVNKIPGEPIEDYMDRCMPVVISEGYERDQAYAICISGWEKFATDYLKDKEMVDGIIELLQQVEDLDNRRQMAIDVLNGFQTDGIVYDLSDFVVKIGFDLEDACWRSYKPQSGFEINVDGLPNYVDETGDLKKKEEEYHAAILKMASEPTFGEVLDIEKTSYISLIKDKFETISDFLRANEAIDILSDIVNSGAEQMVEPSYRYSGGIQANSRNFCTVMVGLGKIYTKAEIDAMSAIPFQPGMGPGGSNTYNIFDYKGGVSCKHFWEQLRVFKSPGGRNIVISEGPATGDAGQIAKRSNNWWRMSKSEWKFEEEGDQMIITGPAMKAFQLIPRKDEDGNLFHVYFSDETIKKLSEKFLKEHKQHMTDINHSMIPDEENNLIESWIVEDPAMDKSKALGFNPSKGDWYVSYRINNKETWKKIKEGKLNGFSIAGQFIERTSQKS